MHQTFRERFFDAMEDGIAILGATPELARNSDTEYRYRPESAFWHLTGLDEPDAIAVFQRSGNTRRFLLFVRPKDPTMELWTGRRLGPEGAVKELGATEAWALEEISNKLDDLLKGHDRLFLPLDGGSLQSQVLGALNRLVRKRRQPGPLPGEIRDVRRVTGELRLRKSAAELAWMEKAAKVTGEAFREVYRLTKPGLAEYQLRAVFPFIYGIHGGDWAFETIVAAGANACTLHYVSCRDRLKKGELVLFDAGAEMGFYAADVTRTIPVDGRFTKRQEQVYRVVLKAHKAAVDTVRPGVTIDEVHGAATIAITEGLLELGILKGKLKTLVSKGAFRPWFPHGTSHWLGLDVHDTGDYALDVEPRRLEEGMVITVEPGLYLGADDKRVPQPLRGMGIRIEDDVLVTATGHRVLTDDIPREPRDIEAAMATKARYLKALALPEPVKAAKPRSASTRTRAVKK
jgi:Xaa-Pro aminopeptidase